MRTTLTLDDDVAANLARIARESGRSFKDVVNDALRLGLAIGKRDREIPPFKIEPDQLIGFTSGFNYNEVEDVFDRLESPRRL